MYHRNVRRYIDTAVLLCRRKPKHMIILIDGAAYCAERVVTVRQYIGNRKLLHPGGFGCLDDPHKGNIMGSHTVKAKF